MPAFYYIDLVPVELTAVAVATSATPGTTTSFTMSIGTAESSRYVLTAFGWQAISTAVLLSSLTIGGVTATLLAQSGYGAGNRQTAIHILAVPAGTGTSIDVTFNAVPSNMGISTFSVSGLISAAANATAISTAIAPTASLSCDEYGAMLGCAYAGAGSPPSATWTGIVEDYDTNIGNQMFSVAHANFSTAQSGLTLTCTPSTSVGSSGSFVSFSPP